MTTTNDSEWRVRAVSNLNRALICAEALEDEQLIQAIKRAIQVAETMIEKPGQ